METKNKLSVTWVISSAVNACIPEKQALGKQLDITISVVTNVDELFPALSDCNRSIDLIVFDLDTLYNSIGMDAFDILNSVSTVSRCAISKPGPGGDIRKCPMLAVAVTSTTSPALLKNLHGTKVQGFIPSGDDFTQEETTHALEELLAGRSYMPKNYWTRR